jgi:hypothetical protein
MIFLIFSLHTKISQINSIKSDDHKMIAKLYDHDFDCNICVTNNRDRIGAGDRNHKKCDRVKPCILKIKEDV